MKAVWVLVLLLAGFGVSAQNKQLLYNVNSLPQNLLTNPGGEARFDMHAGLPFLSQLSFSVGSSGVSLYDVFGNDQSVNENIDKTLGSISEKDFFSVREQVELVSLGWRDTGKNYYSAGVYQETDVFAYFPKDLAILAWEGNRYQKDFHLSDLAFTGEVLNVFHLGATHYFSEDFNLGVRGKVYSSVFNVRSVDNKGNFFSSVSSENGVSQPALQGVDILVKTSGLAPLVGSEGISEEELLSHFKSQAFLGGNIGFGFDIGFTYFLNKQYRITGSILDLGIVSHSKDVKTFRYSGEFTSGTQSTLDPDHPDSGELEEYFKEETLSEPYVSYRPVKLNASIDYGFEEEIEPCKCREPIGRRRYLNHVGFQLFSMKRPKGLVHAATISFDRKFSNNFFGKITYTADSFSFSNIGLLLSGKISNFNLYLAVDNLLDYPNLAKARNASIQMGVQFILNKS